MLENSDEAFGNCVVTCLAFLHSHTAKLHAVSGSEFCNIQLGHLKFALILVHSVISGCVDPNSNYKVGFGFITWQKLTNWLPIMKCLLFASWKPDTTHPLAGYTHQIIGRHRVVVRAHLFSFTSRFSSFIIGHLKMQSGNAQIESCLVWMTHCLDMLVDHWSRRQHAFSLLHSGIQRWARYLGLCETGLHIFADASNAES